MEPATARNYEVKPRLTEFYGVVHQFVPLAASAVGSTDSVQLDGLADFVIDKQAAIYDSGQAKLRLEIVPGKLLESVPVFLSAIGSGQFPSVMPAPQVIGRGNIFAARADDRQLVAAENNIRILHIGRHLYDRPLHPGRRYAMAEPIKLVGNFTSNDGGVGPVARGGVGQVAVPIPSEWDFEVRKVLLLADGDFTIQISQSGRGLYWFNRACHAGLLGATGFDAPIASGSWPFILPVPSLVLAGYSLQLTVTDLSTIPAGTTNRIQVVFWGNKLTPPGGLNTLR